MKLERSPLSSSVLNDSNLTCAQPGAANKLSSRLNAQHEEHLFVNSAAAGFRVTDAVPSIVLDTTSAPQSFTEAVTSSIPTIVGHRPAVRTDKSIRPSILRPIRRSDRVLVRPHLHRHDCQETKRLVGATHNIRSLGKSLEAIKQLAKDEKIGLLCLTETHLESDPIDLRRLRTEGFQVLERARPLKASTSADTIHYRNFGGVAIIASPTIRLTKLNTSSPSSFEHLCSRVTSNGSSCVILLIYRPGSQPVSSLFFDELSSMLEALATSTDPLIVTGDVNIRLDRPDDPNCKRFNELIGSFGFDNRVTEPTHDRGGLLDVLLTRSDLPPPTTTLINTGLSDHLLIKWSTDLRVKPSPYTTSTRRSWSRLNVDEFRSAVEHSTLCDSELLKSLDVDQLGNLYNDVITSILDKLLPVKTVTTRKRPSDPWYDESCRDEKRVAGLLQRQYNRSTNAGDKAINHSLWRDQTRKYRRLLNTKRSNFWLDEINSNRSAPRKLWQSIDKVLGRRRVPADDSLRADQLHDFFDKKVADIRATTADSDSPTFTSTSHSLGSFSPVTSSDVTACINLTNNKQSDLDPIPTWLLKECASAISPFITILFNSSLAAGVFPSVFKSAVITPLLKKQGLEPSDVKHYRPISNLSVLSKILERIVAKQLVGYIDSSSLFPAFQSAYRKFHSTETALTNVLSDILSAIDGGNTALMSMLDMSAAFDTVDHQILLQRLNTSFGISSTVLEWFTSYLSNRQQCVQHSGHTSTTTTLTCGVPQGSVLGPILFILYTADITKIIEKHELHHHLYADDSQIYGFCQPSTVDNAHLRNKLTYCIGEVASWMRSNRLQFNSSKTELIWFTSPRRLNHLDNIPFLVCADLVQPTNEVRDLGLQLDNCLSLVPHITKVVRTCFGVLRQLRTVIRSLPRDVSRQLVQSFVLSHVDYCNATFVGLPQRQLARLQAVVNAAARLVSGVGKYDHITPVLRDDLHILKINERITFKLCLLVFKCLNNLAPQYLRQHIKLLSDEPGRQRLRSSKTLELSVPHTRTSIGDRAFRVAGPSAWNSLPSSVQRATTVGTFKQLLKTHLFRISYFDF